MSDFGSCRQQMVACVSDCGRQIAGWSATDAPGASEIRNPKSEILLKVFAAAVLLSQISFAAVDFDRQVHPILAARCFACHSGDKRSGGLSLSNYSEILRGGKTGKIVNPGSSRDSLLVQRVLGAGMPPMPPLGERLSASEIAALR